MTTNNTRKYVKSYEGCCVFCNENVARLVGVCDIVNYLLYSLGFIY